MDVSLNMITRDRPEGTLRAILSSLRALDPAEEGSTEVVVVDTGSTSRNRKRLIRGLRDVPNARLIEAPELRIPYTPLIDHYLGSSFVDRYRKLSGEKNPHGVRHFGEARNRALDASTKPLLFWIDSDDILIEKEPGKLRAAIDKLFPKNNLLLLDYAYDFADDGVCTTLLRRERVVTRGLFRWVAACHETLIPLPGVAAGSVVIAPDIGAYIQHTETRKRPVGLADIRNYILLAQDWDAEVGSGRPGDPRTLYYMGNAARGLDLWSTALAKYKEFDRVSGSADDRFAAHYFRAAIYLNPGVRRPLDALDSYFECLKIKPDDPRAHFGIQRAYYVLCRWEQSLRWYRSGLQCRLPEHQVMSYDPTHVEYFPHAIASLCAKELHLYEDMSRYADAAAAKRPQAADSTALVHNAKMMGVGDRISKGLLHAAQYASGGLRGLVRQLNAVPPQLEELGISKLEGGDPRPRRPSVAFLCPPTGEAWGPAARASGIGGSEKMVITLAAALQRRGVNVTVYGDPPMEERGISADTGVAWGHYGSFDGSRVRDAVVFWRARNAVLQGATVVARHKVLWNHDVQNPADYDAKLLENLDLVQVQSAYHAAPLRDVVPPEKLWIARNGIEAPTTSGVPRNPKQVLFCSSPDRGLLTAIRIVKAAQRVDPEITLVVTYGFTPWARKRFAQQTHGFIVDLGHESCRDRYEREVFAALDSVGAVVKNRVGFSEMEILMQSSGVWLYPTRFTEISCMSAMEALSNGCVAVSTRAAALDETLGPPQDLVGAGAFTLRECPLPGEVSEDYIEEAALALLMATQVPADAPERAAQALGARARFDIETLADDWIATLGLGGEAEAAGVPPQAPCAQGAQSLKEFDDEAPAPERHLEGHFQANPR